MAKEMIDLPEYDDSIRCTNPECVHKEAGIISGYGMIGGGGLGGYTMCDNCGQVLSKTPDVSHLEKNNEPTEIKTPDVQDPDTDKS